MLKFRHALILAISLIFPVSSYADTPGGFRPITATSTATISATSSSSAPTNANNALQALVCNIGTVEAFVAIGPSTVTATTSGMSFSGGFCTTLQLNPGNYLAAITATGTTTLRVTFASGHGPVAWSGSGGGGGGGGAVFGPTAVGSAAANPPVLVGGTVDGTAAGTISMLKVLGGLAYINCANCSGSGASGTDQAAFTAGASVFAPYGGVFNDGLSALTSGTQAMQRMTSARGGHVNLRNNTGTEIGSAASPLFVGPGTSQTFPISAAALPLPTGASTSANQPTNAALGSTTSGQTGNLALGAVTTAAPTYTTAQTNSLSLTTAGALRTDGSAVTQPVSGTVTAAQVTAANLNATVAPSTLAAWGLVASTQNGATPTNGQLAMGQFNTTPTTITSGNVSPFQMDAAGNLLVNIKAGAGSGGTALADQAAFTQGTTSITPTGCLFISSYSVLTTGKAGVLQCDNTGSLFVNVKNTNANGSATSANSSPVVIASDQAAVAVKAASGSIASGAVASGAYASGSLASGAVVDITNMSGAPAAAVPSKAILAGARSGANIVEVIQASASAAINVSTAVNTQLVALSGATKIYVTSYDVVAGGTGNITFVYGTGTACATGQTSLTGAYNLTAQAGIAKGNGLGPVLVVPAGNALCVVTSAAVQMSGSVAYTQF